MNNSACFSDRIKILIDSFGGASRIAALCGFSEGVVRSWRDGRSDPSRGRCIAMARGLGVSLMWLIAGEGTMTEPPTPSKEPEDHVEVVQKTPLAMDADRLAAAAQVLESTVSLTGETLPLADNTDLLASYYRLLGESDPIARAASAAGLHRELLKRVHKHETSTS